MKQKYWKEMEANNFIDHPVNIVSLYIVDSLIPMMITL